MSERSSMPTIAWDVDDVLNDLTREWFEQWERSGGPVPAGGYGALSANPPHAVLGIARAEYLASLDAFRASAAGEGLAPRAEALEWFERNGDRFRHIAVTATPLADAPRSSAWAMRHFGRWIRTYHLVPSPRPGRELPRYDADKAGFLGWLGKVDLVIDDSVEVVDSARSLGIPALLFPRPWNGAAMGVGEAFDRIVPTLERGAGAGAEGIAST